MAYATVDELAAALRITGHRGEHRGAADVPGRGGRGDRPRGQPARAVPTDDPVANRVNILRGVEWWKANDAAFGILGFDETALRTPRNSFLRHRSALIPLKQQWGVA